MSFVSCAIDHGYIAMGCDGMKHRGPSVFAMLLAYSGCSAKNAATIANKLWGLNFVKEATREAIAEKAFEMGQRQPQMRAALRNVLLAQ